MLYTRYGITTKKRGEILKYSNIRAELARNGLTIEQVAKEMGISTASLSYRLNDHKRFWLDEAKHLVDIFNSRGGNYTIEELFDL